MTQTLAYPPDAGREPSAEPVRVGHGGAFTDHMVITTWEEHSGWRPLQLRRREQITIDPGMIGLHYGQVIFEGLKAHRRIDGAVAAFRPTDHARRFRQSARRLAMPELPEQLFIGAIDEVLAVDGGQLSDDPTHSLYLRPLMFGSEANLMLRPSREYTFLLIAFITGGFFGDELDAISIWVCHDGVRAFPTGTGSAKCAGNYAPTFPAQRRATELGCQQVLWLDATEGQWVEEMSGMSLFLVREVDGNIEVVTPALTDAMLPSVTRDSVLTLAARLGYSPREERVSLSEWRAACQQGRATEAFACGTAAVITPIGRVRDEGGDWSVGDGRPGPVTLALRTALVDVHQGRAPDPAGWVHVGPSASDAAPLGSQ